MAAYYEGADLIKQAALLAIGIAQAQAFLDGNKRTGFAALKVFLEWNVVPLIIDPLSVARQLERVAEGEDRRAAEEAFEMWLREAMTAS
jgi:death-on-curing protein